MDLILQCIPIMEVLCERNKTTKQKINETTDNKIKKKNLELEKTIEEQKIIDDEERLVILLEQRLQFLLRSLTKLFFNKNAANNKKEYVVFIFIT